MRLSLWPQGYVTAVTGGARRGRIVESDTETEVADGAPDQAGSNRTHDARRVERRRRGRRGGRDPRLPARARSGDDRLGEPPRRYRRGRPGAAAGRRAGGDEASDRGGLTRP